METGRLRVNRPVRRKLLIGSIAHIAGIYAAQAVCLPDGIACFCCALFLCMGVWRLRHRKSALLFVTAVLFILGNGRAGHELFLRDEPTEPGVWIEGTVCRIESDTRVYLSDVVIDGERILRRPVAVTLMQERDEAGNPIGTAASVEAGQTVYGTGRLFAQQEKRNPGGIDWRIQSLCKGYDLSGYILPGWAVKGEPTFSLAEVFRKARLKLSSRIEALFGTHAPLFSAVITGDRTDMDEELVEAMRLTGIVHILTISGMHMSLIALAIHALLSKLRVGRWLRFMLQALLLGCFACLTGGAVGTIRAYMMAMIRAFAALSGRRYDPLSALAAAALVITLVFPIWALSVSFQFSFMVVLGIHLLSRQLMQLADRRMQRSGICRSVFRMAALTVSAQLTAIPMQLMCYGYVPVLSMPMNLICGVFMPVLMLGGWGVLGMSLFLPRAARIAAEMLGACAALLEAMSLSASSHPWGIIRMPAPDGITLIICFLLLFAASNQIYMGKHRKRCCALLIIAGLLPYIARFDPAFRYVQLDVGQGDSAVLRKHRRAVLIDVGPEDDRSALLYLRNEGLYVDMIVLSHMDEDHAGALGTLLDSEIRIDRIAIPKDTLSEVGSPSVLEALDLAHEMGIRIEQYEKGDRILAGSFEFSVLSPDDSMRGSNERSFALYTETDGVRILTLGDLPEKSEMESVPPCDVLKVAHHGSRYATSRRLIDQAQPDVAVISVGRNSYGHPTDRVLEDLWAVGASVYRTDISGCITVSTEGEAIQVTTYIP